MVDWTNPSIDDFATALRIYGQAGVKWFNSELDATSQGKIRKILPGVVEVNEAELAYKFSLARSSKTANFKFIPIPKPHGKQFHCAFFYPKFSFTNQSYSCEFMLLIWVAHDDRGVPDADRKGQLIAFRFELPHLGGDGDGEGELQSHAYHHVQVTRSNKAPVPVFKTSLPEWFPDSYPGLPISARTPMQYFATMMASVYGYNAKAMNEFLPKVVTDIYQVTQPSAAKALHNVAGELFAS